MLSLLTAQRIFPIIYGFVKHLIDETRQSKLVVLGGKQGYPSASYTELESLTLNYSLTANWREEINQSWPASPGLWQDQV